MQFIINSRMYSINSLDQTLDGEFLKLHSAYFGDHLYNWDDISTPATNFFNNAIGNFTLHDLYFNNFTIIWRFLLSNGRMDEAGSLWQMILQTALTWEAANPGHFIHKGTPFYFWGMTAILQKNIDKGFVLMHQSLQEDIRTSGNQFPDTPSFALATINYDKVDQAFRNWLLVQAQYLQSFIVVYQSSRGRGITLDDFRSKFLAQPPNTEITFLFSYIIARLYLLNGVPDFALQSDFVGQLDMNLLFDLTLVIDAAIKAKNPNPNQWRFIELAEFLSNSGGLSLDNQKLREINTSFNNGFDVTLIALLDGNYNFSDGSTPTLSEVDIAISYGIRNYAAHHLTSVSTIWQRFNEIRQNLLNTIFFTVETLY